MTEHSAKKFFFERANSRKLFDIFNKYASVEKNGEKLMTSNDFLIKYLKLFPEKNFNSDSVSLFSGIVNTKKTGYISFKEFQEFEGILCFPDALYKTAFQLFDTNGNGEISFDEFVEVITKTDLHKRIPVNIHNEFVDLYFGKDRERKINYSEFSQFLHDFHEEYAIEAFRKFDKDGSGFISITDFNDIMINIKSHLLTKEVAAHLTEAVRNANIKQMSTWISFPYFIAFNSLLNNMELIKKIYLNATNNKKTVKITKENFLLSAQRMSQITPLEVDILFQLCDALQNVPHTGKIVYNDLTVIAPEPYFKEISQRLTIIHAVSNPEERTFLIQTLENMYRFFIGSVAGVIGLATVYPLDLSKNKFQNQITKYDGERMYRSPLDCFRKVLRYEGMVGLYKGLLPQCISIGSEKGIKLTVNDFIRDLFIDVNGNIPLYGEITAGALAGAAQVTLANPADIIKHRLQLPEELSGRSKVTVFQIIKEVGMPGLYKGSLACLLRDVPFTAMYFPSYSYAKRKLADENKYNSAITLFVAGFVAAIPATLLVSPIDTIKNRLQVTTRRGVFYSGIWDATRKIYREEGHQGFWKGTLARIIRISPQLGVTLLFYEIFQRFFYVDFGGTQPSGSNLSKSSNNLEAMRSTNPDHIGGYQVAKPIFAGIETKFGLSLPKFAVK